MLRHIRHTATVLLTVAVLFGLGGCSSLISLGSDPRLVDSFNATPDIHLTTKGYQQSDYFCGPAALASLMSDKGMDVDVDSLASEITTAQREGTFKADMTARARRDGFLALTVENEPEALSQTLIKNQPTAVLVNLSLPAFPKWHYFAVVGFKKSISSLSVFDGNGEKIDISLSTFNHLWARANYWLLAIQKPNEQPLPWVTPELWLEETIALGKINPSWQETAAKTGERVWPKHHGFPFVLGSIDYEKGRASSALDYFKKVIELSPSFVAGYYNLAWIEKEQKNLTSALDFAERGKALSKQSDREKFDQLIAEIRDKSDIK